MAPCIQEHENIYEHNDETGNKIDQWSHHSTDNSANAAIIFTFKYFFLIAGSDSKLVIKKLLYIINTPVNICFYFRDIAADSSDLPYKKISYHAQN